MEWPTRNGVKMSLRPSEWKIGSEHWTFACLATGAGALVCQLLAVATTHWLNLSEFCIKEVEHPVGNITLVLTLNFTMFSYTGLWQFCMFSSADEKSVTCTSTNVFSGLKKDGQNDDQWQSGAVVESTRIQFPFVCVMVILTVVGFVYSALGNYRRDRNIMIAAVLYILGGLCLSVSIIVFISTINDEMSLRGSQSCRDFRYHYGWSMYLIGLSFVMEETSAVISIKLFLLRHCKQVDDMVRIIPGLEDKLFVETSQLNKGEMGSQTLIW